MNAEYPIEMTGPRTWQSGTKRLPISVGTMKTVTRRGVGVRVTGSRKVTSMLMEALKVSHVRGEDLTPSIDCEAPLRGVAIPPNVDDDFVTLHDGDCPEGGEGVTNIVQTIQRSNTHNVDVGLHRASIEDLWKPIRQCMTEVLRGMDLRMLVKIQRSKEDELHSSEIRKVRSRSQCVIVGCEQKGCSWLRMGAIAADATQHIGDAKLIMLDDPERNLMGQRRTHRTREWFQKDNGTPIVYVFFGPCGWMDILNDMHMNRNVQHTDWVWCDMIAGATVILDRVGIVNL